jgi:ankyrin repeat protein
LIDAGANVNACNQITGATPLHAAIQSSKASLRPQDTVRVVQLLLERGKANSSAVDVYGSPPYDYLRDTDSEELRALLQPEKPAIVKAIETLNTDHVHSILRESPSRADIVYMGKTPLLISIDILLQEEVNTAEKMPELLSILIVLLKYGANPNAVSTRVEEESQGPPLHRLCLTLRQAYSSHKSDCRIAGWEEAALLLVQKGAIIADETKLLLHDAARRGNLRLVQFLTLKLDIDVNMPGRQGMTALQFAARSGKVETVKYLLEQTKVDLNITDDLGRTALDAAMANEREEIVQLLKEYCHNQ